MSLQGGDHRCSHERLHRARQGRHAKSYLPVAFALGSPHPRFSCPPTLGWTLTACSLAHRRAESRLSCIVLQPLAGDPGRTRFTWLLSMDLKASATVFLGVRQQGVRIPVCKCTLLPGMGTPTLFDPVRPTSGCFLSQRAGSPCLSLTASCRSPKQTSSSTSAGTSLPPRAPDLREDGLCPSTRAAAGPCLLPLRLLFKASNSVLDLKINSYCS